MMTNMVQYGLWANCPNNCKFCLLRDKNFKNKNSMINIIRTIKSNIDYIDWKSKFSAGISLIGGELYYITDTDIQSEFLLLIDKIIERILKVSTNPLCRYSSVTNGLYNPEFLYQVVDKLVNSVGIEKLDLNFSFDLKYRYNSDDSKNLALRNINEFHKKYNYELGVQMILTQYVINLWKHGEFNIQEFVDNNFPGNKLCFLYPHPIHGGLELDEFKFNRYDFIRFINNLKLNYPEIYKSFYYSTINSGIFKYSGLTNRESMDYTQQPILFDGKEILSSCGHSILYKCYADSNKCMLCDLVNIGN